MLLVLLASEVRQAQMEAWATRDHQDPQDYLELLDRMDFLEHQERRGQLEAKESVVIEE